MRITQLLQHKVKILLGFLVFSIFINIYTSIVYKQDRTLLQLKVDRLEEEKSHEFYKHDDVLQPNGKHVKIANEMTEDELNPSSPFRLRIIIPTIPREGKYDYLYQTFESVSNNFGKLNIDFNVIAFSRSSQKPAIVHPRFKFIQIEDIQLSPERTPKPLEGYVRGPKVLRQNLDWIAMMEKWKTMCVPGEIYLYMEDDFTICPHAEQHILSTYLWALKHRSAWKSLRISIGFNGLFMKCEDTAEYIAHVWENALNPQKVLYPVDYSLGMMWTSVGKLPQDKVHYTFRYNLLNHIGKISSVGNEGDTPYNPKCFDGMANNFNFAYEKFDNFDCKGHLFTPCRIGYLQRDLEFHGQDGITTQSILKKADRNLLLTKIKAEIIQHKVTDSESCNQICSKNMMKCEISLYPLVNNCEEFRDRFKCHSNKCFGLLWGVWNGYVPFYGAGAGCILQDAPSWECEATYKVPDSTKLCPCIISS
jgi:hypothetical protein